MDLQISVFLLFILFTAGHSFSCYECSGLTGSCANQKLKTCPSGFSKCMSFTTVIQAGIVKYKDCAADCATGSMHIGTVKTSFACCDTDQCNVQDAPDPSDVPNGKKCYSCAKKSCSNILSCSGSEDRCLKATGTLEGQSLAIKGCVSKSICDVETSFRSVENASCCSGNLCNGAQTVTQSINGAQSITQVKSSQVKSQSANSANSVTQSFLFLCCSLLSFILLH